MKLKGGCIHHDLGIFGATEYEDAERRKIRKLKESGYNALRLAHNPFGNTFFKLCDELGMLVIEEAFDEWVLGRTSFGSHLFFEYCWEQDLEAMVIRDYNHPSIIMWSVGNEVEERDGSADGYAWSRKLAEKVRNMDGSRPVSATACSLFVEYTQARPKDEGSTTGNQALNMAYDNFASGVDLWGDATEEYFAPMDVAGYNYKTARYEFDHEKFPQRVIYGSESYPRAAFLSWKAAENNRHVIGDFVWTAWDYIGEVGVGRWEVSESESRPQAPAWPWLLANCADIDLIGEKRPQSYYRDAVWENDHAPHLFTLAPELVGKNIARLSWAWLPVQRNYTFENMEGSPIEAHVYANADEVELLVNGRSLGKKECGEDKEYQAVFTFPYEKGKLEAVAYVAGSESGRDVIRTAAETEALMVSAEKEQLTADGRSLVFLTVSAVDGQGIPVLSENGDIEIHVENGELAAAGTADPKPERLRPFRENILPLFEGKALMAIKSSHPGGMCTVRVSLRNGCEESVEIPLVHRDDTGSSYISEPVDSALNLTVGELLGNDGMRKALEEYLPELVNNPMIVHMKSMTLKKVMSMGGMEVSAEMVSQLEKCR